MKHLKLFEAYSQRNKVEMVNNILVEYFLFNFFLDNEILVKKSYVETGVEYGFWYSVKHGRLRFLRYLVDKSIVLKTFFTEKSFVRGFRGYLNEETIKDNLFVFINGALKPAVLAAVKKYIGYLKNTPDKKHLLQE